MRCPTDSETGRGETASDCEPYRDFIELSLTDGRNAEAIYQDLVHDHGFTGCYASVRLFAPAVAARKRPEAHVSFTPAQERNRRWTTALGPWCAIRTLVATAAHVPSCSRYFRVYNHSRMFDPFTIGLGLLGAGTLWVIGKLSGSNEQPAPPEPAKASSAPPTPAPSLIQKVCEEVKQAVSNAQTVASEKIDQAIELVAETVEQTQEFIADATERISEGVRHASKVLTSLVMGLTLPWSGITLLLRDVQLLRKLFLKSSPLIRAPSFSF